MVRYISVVILVVLSIQSHAQDVVEDKYLQQTNRIISYYDEFIDIIHKKDSIEVIKSLNILYKSLNKYPYRDIVHSVYLGIYNNELGHYKEALKNYQCSLHKLKNISERNKSIIILDFRISMLIGHIYIDYGDFEKGVGYLLESIEKAKSISDKEGLTYLYQSMALLYDEEFIYTKELIDYVDKAYEYADAITNEEYILESKLFLLHTLLNAGKIDDVKEKLKILAPNENKINKKEILSSLYILKIQLAISDKNYNELNNLIISIERDHPEIKSINHIDYYKAILYSSKGQTKNAIKFYENAITEYEKDNNLNALYETYYLLAKEYIKDKNSTKVLSSIEKMFKLSDSIDYKNQEKNISITENKYKMIKAEMELLKAHNHSKRKSKIILYIVLFSTLLIILLSRLLFLHMKIRKHYSILINKSQEITQKEIGKSSNRETINDKLVCDIKRVIEDDKAYLDSNIKLANIAEMINSNTSYVSEAINKYYGKNFSSLISELRIKAILKKIEEEDIKMFTIESLGAEVGFNSRTAFYNAFKTHTGVTPKYYIDNINKNS